MQILLAIFANEIFIAYFHMQNLGLVFPHHTPPKREKLLGVLRLTFKRQLQLKLSTLVTAHAQSESHRNMFYAPAILLQLKLKSPQPQAERAD